MQPSFLTVLRNFNQSAYGELYTTSLNMWKVNKITGMDITFVTDTNSDSDALNLLKEFGLPFKEDNSRKEELKSQNVEEVHENPEDFKKTASTAS